MIAQVQTEFSPLASGLLSPELELVLLIVRLRMQRRAAWLRQIASPDADLFDADSPANESEWIEADQAGRMLTAQIDTAEEALQNHLRSKLFGLRDIFGLSAQEFDLIQACLAVSLDPQLARVCRLLHGDTASSYMSADLAARLFMHGRCAAWNPESPLLRWRLVERCETTPGEPTALSLDPGIREWLRGSDDLDRALTGVARLHPLREPFDHWPIERTVTWLKAQLQSASPRPMRVRVVGPHGSGRRTFAAIVSARLGMPLLAIRADEVDDAAWRSTFIRAQRHAFLQRCALAWAGESLARRTLAPDLPHFPLQFFIAEHHEDSSSTEGAELRIELPPARTKDRILSWRSLAPASWSDQAITGLADKHRVQVGDIARACSAAPADPDEAGLRVREASRGALGSLAQLLPCSFAWDDLVLPETILESLRDLVYEARHRNEFWENPEAQRLFPQGRGLLALFNGPPGTGKTMAAQVIASALGYDLLRIDLSTVVSKYVGETAQNLERILSRAAHMDAVLLFDEADGLFGKRAPDVKEAQDKFANTESAYLLQAIESYPGIALLASNQKGSIDNAFLRRVRFVVEFSRPDAAQRTIIWRRVCAGLLGTDATEMLVPGLKELALNIEATGAQIKNAVLGAIFIARRLEQTVDIPHLLRGLEREIAKEGRTLSHKEKERIRAGGAQ